MWTLGFVPSVVLALKQWRLAMLLAWASVLETRRLNRIALATPFLVVLVQAGILGAIYCDLLGTSFVTYLPFLAVSLALWQGFSVFISQAANYNEVINRHLSFSRLSIYTLHLAGLTETFMLLAAKLAAALAIIVVAGRGLSTLAALPLAVLGIAVLAVHLFFLGVIVAYLLDRFRFLRALLPQMLVLLFLVTPVMWQKDQITGARWLVELNPLSHGIDIVRQPLLNGTMPWYSLLIILIITLLTVAACSFVHRANRELILFRWVS